MNIAITDLSGQIADSNHAKGRNGLTLACIVLHDTAGAYDNNNMSDLAALKRIEQATLNWLLGQSGAASAHYMIGAEKLGAKIYKLCKEENTAYHAAGKPTRNTFFWNGVSYGGVMPYDGCSKINRGSIGIEVFGQPNEIRGPYQEAALLYLVTDIAKRHNLVTEQIISHRWLQTNRTDGEIMLDKCRAAVTVSNEPQVLPYDSVLTADDFLFVGATGYLIKGAILDAFLTFSGAIAAPSQAEYATRIIQAVKVYGLPKSEETDYRQKFEKGTLVYNPNEADGWQTRLATVN